MLALKADQSSFQYESISRKKRTKKKKKPNIHLHTVVITQGFIKCNAQFDSFFFKQSETVCKLIKIKVKLIEYTILFKIFETKKY